MKLPSFQSIMAKLFDGLYSADYTHDKSRRDEIETHLDLLDYKLAARVKLLEIESKTLGRKQ